MSEHERPKVGIGVFIVKSDMILLGKRKNAHGAGEFATPGGHLEHGETWEECALRETAEEAGDDLKIKVLGLMSATNQLGYLPLHYVNLGMKAEWVSGEPKVMEPNKLESWGWYPIDDLPTPLFEVTPNYVEAYRTGRFDFS